MREFTKYNLEDLQYDNVRTEFFTQVIPKMIFNYLNETGRHLQTIISIDGNLGFIAFNDVDKIVEAYLVSYGIGEDKLIAVGPESVDLTLNSVAKQLKTILDTHNPDKHFLIRFTAEKHEFNDVDSNGEKRNQEKYLCNSHCYTKLADPYDGETIYVNNIKIVPLDEEEWRAI